MSIQRKNILETMFNNIYTHEEWILAIGDVNEYSIGGAYDQLIDESGNYYLFVSDPSAATPDPQYGITVNRYAKDVADYHIKLYDLEGNLLMDRVKESVPANEYIRIVLNDANFAETESIINCYLPDFTTTEISYYKIVIDCSSMLFTGNRIFLTFNQRSGTSGKNNFTYTNYAYCDNILDDIKNRYSFYNIIEENTSGITFNVSNGG